MRFNLALIATSLLAIGGYMLYNHTQKLDHLQTTINSLTKDSKLPITQASVNGQASAGQTYKNWGSLQSAMKDAVIQVFSEISDFNWLEPYKSPNQYQSSGSGFFINDQGEMITNAHVVDQAKAISIQIPSFGKRRFDVKLLGVSPERDLALIKLKEENLSEIKKALGKLPFLTLGNSDHVHRSDELMAIGYPLGQQSLKSTTGIVSGPEHISGQYMIQISAPINPGSSGGPSINCTGEVIGVNSSGIVTAQNVGYVIPSNEVKLFLNHLKQLAENNAQSGKVKFLRKPFLGILFNPASESLTHFLGNPAPGGLYVAGTQKNSPLHKAGVKAGDMIYEIDGHRLDIFGDMNMPWSEDKISVIDYISRLMIGDQVNLVIYRNGKKQDFTLTFRESELAPIRRMYPGYEKIDYEIIGGLVIMPLSMNHLPLLVQVAPELTRYVEIQNQLESALIITHVFPTSCASRTRTIGIGAIIKEANGKPVKTLDELRQALKLSVSSKYLTIKTNQNIFAALSFEEILKDEERLSRDYIYTITKTMQEFIDIIQNKNQSNAQKKA